MDLEWLVRWCFLFFLTPLTITLDQASFYGGSYILIPFKEARSSTDIHFKLKTHLPNALILLAVGATDYCIVRLENGRLKVNINLGAGESELLTSKDVKLNDFKWHDVFVIRKEANLSILVDSVHRVDGKLPGKFFELNVHYGLFVGGRSNYSDLFFGHSDKFRGCLAEVMYNGILVLDQARHRHQQAEVHGVTWNCAAEFDAKTDTPISFVDDGAFMSLPYLTHHTQLKLEFEFKTILENTTLVYNSGPLPKPSFFALEIWNGHTKCTLKHTEKHLELTNANYVSDGRWHKLFLRINHTGIDLIVDGVTKSLKKSRNHAVEFSDPFYVGGVEKGKLARAAAKGLKTLGSSFKGCLRGLMVDGHHRGLPDAVVTQGLLPNCVWEYPCLSAPCTKTSKCVQLGVDSFDCQCEQELCINPNYTQGYTVFSHDSLATNLQLLELEPLELLEGRSTVITSMNLHVILDYPKYGIQDSGIQFSVVEPASYGSITMGALALEKNTFTLDDISQDRVHYIHDGSENYHDYVILEMRLSAGESYTLPAYLQGKFRFTLAVNVVPVNDAPILDVPTTVVLRLPQGGRTTLSRDTIKIEDPDSEPQQLVINVIQSDCGHFEFKDKTDTKITSFTLENIDNKSVIFVHHKNASNDSHVVLQVSDGIETSPVAKLRISAFPQYWRLQNNTGVILTHHSYAVVTPYNLSFVSNVAGADDGSAQFQIIQGPLYGVVEVEKEAGVWKNVAVFSNGELKQHRVRYRHVTSTPQFDEFQFKTTLNTSSVYTFRMTFTKCELVRRKSDTLQLNSSTEATIKPKHLTFTTKPITSTTTSIIYTLIKPPMYGIVFSAVSKYRLRINDVFSQEDISSQNLKYRLFRKAYSPIEDEFEFAVYAPGCKNVTAKFSISYTPKKEILDAIEVVLKTIHVNEGEAAIVRNSDLYLGSNLVSDLFFNVSVKPKYGELQIVDGGGVVRNGTDFFTLYELRSEQVYYIHDGSESTRDGFTFLALSREEEDFEYVGSVDFNISLVNDNSLVRTVDKVFNVVVGGKRLLTGDDLKYSDEDVNTRLTDIVYTCGDLPNGEFYNVANSTTKITQFTQEDLDKGRILFKHKGSEYGKVNLWVTDGKFYVNGVLEIHASAPFIRVATNKKLIVQQGKSAVITHQHLTYSTNIYASDADVVYKVATKPTFGRVVNTATAKDAYEFTHEDVVKGHISYLHEVAASDADEISLRVKCEDVSTDAQLGVWMLPNNFWEPLIVKNHKSLNIEEATSASINKNIFEIIQPNVPPSSITYHVRTPPQNGYLSILPSSQITEDHPVNVQTFTQTLINDNRVLYIQSGANQTHDTVTFNITNGIVWLNNLVLDIEIIPEHIYLGSNVLTVNEGGIATISTVHIFIQTEYYRSKVTDYIISQHVTHGCVQIRRKCTKQYGFSHKELLADIVRYAHDGSENLEDELTIVAVAGQKRSFPVTIKIKVLPVNDQKPQLVNNTGLIMWEGGTAIITNQMLAATDDDRPKDTLRYQVLRSWWGNVSLLTDQRTPLQYFTQELIDRNLVAFCHQNGSEAKFSFQISDGLHTTKEHYFHIKAKPVTLSLFTKPLHIFPLQRKFLTSTYLTITVSDPEREVFYEIVQPPSLGRLMTESDTPGIFKVISRFTQSDLNDSRLFYEHTHPFADLYMNDSFVFNARAPFTEPLLNKKLDIYISVSSGGLDAYVMIPRITVDEGGMTKIVLNLSGVVTFLESHAGVQKPIVYAIVEQPRHGQVFLQNFPNSSAFTKEQLESGDVHYQHDHSDTLGDNIYMSLRMKPGSIVLCNITVPILVNPINDQAFKLVTPAPHISVVQGENHTITKNELLTEDADTPPKELEYAVVTGPSKGKLVLLPEGLPIVHFTQADINDNRVVYVHNSSILMDQFHLRVWDGKFRPEFTVFNVQVIPIYMNVSAGLPLFLQQGSDSQLLTTKQFFINTNADLSKVHYTIKEPPANGELHVKYATAVAFTQSDLENQNVMYIQTNMTAANDTFKIYVEIVAGNTSVGGEVQINVKVQPLMQIGNFTAVVGASNKVSLHALDATPLAKLTNSTPRYLITSRPRYGQIRKVIRSSGEHRNLLNTTVNSFTHEEIKNGLIYFVTKDVKVGLGLQDQMGFMLAVNTLQPAMGTLIITLRTSLSNDIYSTLAGPSDPAGHEGGMQFASPNMTRDYFLIVSMVFGVVVLGVAVIVIIKCRSLEPGDMKKDEQALQPLPRPPDRLMSSSPSLKQPMQDGYVSPIPAALPHCKVTLLNRSDLDTHARYPYGAEEHSDEWSSCEASDPACPPSRNIMLRRNQYWV